MYYPERQPSYRSQRVRRHDDVNQAVAASVGGIIETPKGGIPPKSVPKARTAASHGQVPEAFSRAPGLMTIQATVDQPYIGAGQAKDSVFDVAENTAKMLIARGEARPTQAPLARHARARWRPGLHGPRSKRDGAILV